MQHIFTYILIAAIGLISSVLDPAYAEDTADPVQSASSSSYAQAQELISQEKYADALAVLADLTETQPENADAWNLFGYSNRKLGNYDAAAMAYETALRLNPGHLGALEYQGEMYVETGKLDLARDNLSLLKSICGSCEQSEDLENSIQKSGN
jgi:Flp pilus assembly protein TadD